MIAAIDTIDIFADDVPRARLAVVLKHFSAIDDDREPWRVVYPLAEVLACAIIASCDDFDDIVAWGERHLDFFAVTVNPDSEPWCVTEIPDGQVTANDDGARRS